MEDSSKPSQKYAGVRAIGDVHGEAAILKTMLEAAGAEDLFVVQLGDLVDRGPDSIGALRMALDLCARGTGLFLRANHDDKLRRALKGNPAMVGVDLQRTLDSLASAPDHATLLGVAEKRVSSRRLHRARLRSNRRALETATCTEPKCCC